MHFIHNLDLAVNRWFAANRTQEGIHIMRDITALGGTAVLTLMVVFTVGLLLAFRRRLTALFVLIAVLGGWLLADLLKQLIGRPRPEVTEPVLKLILPHSASFPSGHSMISAVVYLTIALLLTGRLRGRRTDAYLVGWSLFLTFLVGISRLYLGVHYFTDVIVGWIVGLSWALACRWVEDHWTAIRERAVAVDEEEGAGS
jgi:undecaprenyl-diphosphatase